MIRRCTSSAIEHAGTASTSKSSVLLTPPAARMGSAVNHRRQSSYERASARLLAPDCLNLTLSPKWKRHGLQLSDRLDAGKRELHSTSTTRATRVVDYLLADVGEGITECEIIKWFVAPANDVAEFDALVEVQSDKASVEITSRYAGRIIEQCYAVGQVARVGTPLCRIEVEDDTESAPAELSSERLEPTNASTAASESSISSNVTPSAQEIHPSAASFSPSSGKHAALATPAVRRICREEQVDVSDVTGTGKDGRVTKEDVMMYVATRSSAAESSPGIMPTDATHAMTNEQDTEVELNSIKRAMFRAMTASWNIPHFGYSEELDVTELERLRKSINASREQTATKLTMLPLLLKALSMALYDHALFRCMVPSQGASSSASAPSTLLQRATHDISIALSTPSGLLTPTLPDIRQLSVWDISQHVKRLQDKASSRESRGLSRADLRSDRPGSITLSNVGTVGGTAMSPLLPPTGQLAIGAIGKARLLPRYVDEAGLSGHVNASPIAQPRLILPTSWTADHRFVEGVELAKLVQDWKANVEHPHRWFLRLR